MYPLLIIILMLMGLFIYFKTKNYLTWNGILLAIIILVSVYLRMRYVDINHSNIFDFQLISFIPYLLSLILVYIVTRKDIPTLKERLLHFLKLLPLYLLFGIVQQFIFLFLVTDTLFFLTRNYYIAGIVSIIYYYLFHIMYKDKLETYLPYLLMFSIVNVFVYFYFDTILPQIVFHGILGALLFTIGTEEDLIKERF